MPQLIESASVQASCRVNVVEGEPNDRLMTTGNHTVRDIYCIKCATTLGWKYVWSFHTITSSRFNDPVVDRIVPTRLRRDTRRASTSSSATSS